MSHIQLAEPPSFRAHAARPPLAARTSRSCCACVWVQDKCGRTALHWAVECRQHAAAECLLDYRANPLITEFSGRNTFFLAAKNNDLKMLELLCVEVPPAALAVAVSAADGAGLTPISFCRERCAAALLTVWGDVRTEAELFGTNFRATNVWWATTMMGVQSIASARSQCNLWLHARQKIL